MLLKNHAKNHVTVMRAGMLCLVAGALLLRFPVAFHRAWPNLADGLSGLFYGAAIALLLVSIRMRCARPDA